MKCNLNGEVVEAGGVMTHLPGSPTSRIGAAINREAQSSRKQGVMRGLAAREVEIMIAPGTGSTMAFDELQKVYSSRLFKTILRITKNWEDAEDALQDTFLRAYLALHGFEGRSSVYSWLTRIAINSALMVLRRRRSRPETLLICSFEEGDCDSPLELKDSSSNPEQLCDLRQRRDHVLQAIRNLESSLRAPIEAQLARGYSVKEVADTLNISVAAAKARLYRARVRLLERASVHSGARKRAPARFDDTGTHANLKNREQQWTTCG
jgi:RNA polymerase sigma-70 factor (ECF subfamily)